MLREGNQLDDNGLLHLQSAQHVSGTYMPIIRSSRLYLCYYRIWCVMPCLQVVGGQVQGSRLCIRDEGSCSSSFPHPGHIASIVWSSWWWAYKYPKHVEQIISAINTSVASSWVSSLGISLKLFYLDFVLQGGASYKLTYFFQILYSLKYIRYCCYYLLLLLDLSYH